MNREIKFRAWDKVNKKWDKSTQNFLRLCDGHLFFGNADIDGFPLELMQYTGLKDKNGVEIYEGDVVREYEDYFVSDPDFTPEILGDYLVKWDLNGFWLDNRIENEYGFGDTDFIEVIGNIYENPELLQRQE